MKNNNINKILDDLYILDPSLKKEEEKVRKLVLKLIENKPEIKIDNSFYYELKRRIIKKENNINLTQIFMSFKKQIYLVGSFAVVAILLVVIVSMPSIKKFATVQEGDSINLSLSPQIESVGGGAFGSLSSLVSGGVNEESVAPADGASERVVGLGGGGVMSSSVPTPMMADSKMIAPFEPYSYNFVLTDENFNLGDNQVEVLKKIKDTSGGVNLASFFSNKDFGFVDLENFENLKIENITISEDKNLGYSIYLNLNEGVVSISENWSKWNATEEQCLTEECFQKNRIKISDIPPDAELIKTADDFLREKNIDTSSYGEGFVDNSWRDYYEISNDKLNYYLPDVLTVVYPQIINGVEVFDQGGINSGLMVNVNVRRNKASGVFGINTQNYLSSKYDSVVDKSKVIDFAKKGGFNYFYSDENSKKIDIELGSPKRVYVKTWKYENGSSEELLVPSLLFPVLNVPEGVYFYQKAIYVPLVEEMLDSYENQPRPMPLMRETEILENQVETSDIESLNLQIE